jgi:dTDP-4-dehydrorhamnose 3,5-epimerase
VGSPTFGQFDGEVLTAENGKCVLIKEGLGHVFLSLEDDTVVNYLCSEPFSPTTEHGINPLDKGLAIPFESMWSGAEFSVSEKDQNTSSLAEMLAANKLPTYSK